jgi:hypothetical protein
MNVREGISCHMNWDGDRVLNRTVVMISSDKFPPDQCKTILISKILCSFGLDLSKEIDVNEKSCLSWYDSGAQAMSDLDRKLLAFLYQHIPNKTNRSELRSIFRKKWQP